MSTAVTFAPTFQLETVRPRCDLTVLALFATDIAAVSLSALIAATGHWLIFGGAATSYFSWWPGAAMFVLAYGMRGLYPGVGLNAIEELRRLTVATSLVYGTFLAAFNLLNVERYSRLVLFAAWAVSVALVPLGRTVTRRACRKHKWWGVPVLVFGAGTAGREVVRSLSEQPELGLRPVAVLDDYSHPEEPIAGVPIAGPCFLAPDLARRYAIRHAIIALPRSEGDHVRRVLREFGEFFAHVLLIPDMPASSNLWIEAKSLGPMLGLNIRQNLLMRGPIIAKRLMDICLAAVIGMLCTPAIVLIALLIRLTSTGAAFYSQTRIGKDGRRFRVLKFRTMIVNADQALFQYLDNNPRARAEYATDRKLKHDPRITRIGAFLRKTSLDELPQLWNVLKGEMSLVGPRPIVDEERWKYGEHYHTYLKVTPGITGLWQVSGRNDVTYAERVELDTYYVYNWSPWVDLYVLARTVEAVLRRRGAY